MRACLSKSAAAIAITLASLASAQPGPPAMDPELEAVMKKALEDARALSRSLPDRARLGADWKTAWELPANNPARVASEEAYWQNLGRNLGFAGLSEAQARKMIDSLLQQFGAMGAKEGMTQRDMIMALLIKVQGENAPTAMKTTQTWETAAATFKAVEAQQASGERPNPRDGQRKLFDVMGAPYKSLSDDQMKDLFVRTAALAQKRTEMTYYLCNNWAGLAQARSDEDIAKAGIWIGMIKINLMLADPYKTTEPMDLAKEDAPALQSRIMAAVKETATRGMAMQRTKLEAQMKRYNEMGDTRSAERVQEQLRKESASMASLDAKVEMLELGDNSYMVRITGVSPDTVGMQFGMFNGWIRKGPAMAEVSVGGNMPQKEMDLVMKKVLDELDAKLGSYESSMFARIDVNAGAPKYDPSAPIDRPKDDGRVTNPRTPAKPKDDTETETRNPPMPPPPPPPPPGQDPVQYTQGMDAYNTKDMRKAQQLFDEALKQSPNNPRVLLMRGASKYQQNDLNGALADYRAATVADPNNAQYRKYAGFLELLAGDIKGATAQADAAMKLAPNDPDAMLLRAQVASGLDRHDEAKQLYANIAKLNPQRAQTLYNEAGVALDRGSYVEAILQFESVLQLNPNLYQAHFGRGKALAARGNNRGALNAYQTYLKYDTTSQFATQARQEIDRLKRAK